MHYRTIATLGAVALLCQTAFADSIAPVGDEGWYAGLFGLGGFTSQSDRKQSPNRGTPVTGDTDTDGLSGGGGIWGGYNFGKEAPFSLEFATSARVRHDLDLRYFNNSVSTSPLGVKGNVTTVDFMLSGLYNIPTGYKITPYVGAGAGVVYYYSSNYELTATQEHVGAPSSDGINPAWQLQAGFKYPLSANSELRLDYRYIEMGRIDTSRMPSGDKLSADLASNDFRLGVAWGF